MNELSALNSKIMVLFLLDAIAERAVVPNCHNSGLFDSSCGLFSKLSVQKIDENPHLCR